jgi:nucleotidyltransferase substrate binding protein (TIGR01987 family)
MTVLNWSNLQKAVESLDDLLAHANNDELMSQLDDVIRFGIKAGVVKNFEFTYELSWKAMKRWLEENLSAEAVDGVTRRELFRLSAENRLITDVEEWMNFHAARNHTSHMYDEAGAEAVYRIVGDFLAAAQRLLAALEARNA